MMQAQVTDLRKKVADLKKSKDAIILAHNYQIPEVQDVADYVGDSLGLARKAANTENKRIVFCGVHFMAETASMCSPYQKKKKCFFYLDMFLGSVSAIKCTQKTILLFSVLAAFLARPRESPT